MSYMTLGADDLFTLNATLDQLDTQLAAMTAAWDSTIGQTVPPQFVLDVTETLLEKVVTPFSNLRMEMAADPANLQITQLIREAGSAGDVIWQDRLLPVLYEALEQKRARSATMTIPSDMKQRVIAVVTFYKEGYIQLRDALEQRSWWAKLGSISRMAIEFLVGVGNAAKAVKEWFETNVYDPIVRAVAFTKLLIYATLAGSAAYIVYKATKPRANPARRRRRRR